MEIGKKLLTRVKPIAQIDKEEVFCCIKVKHINKKGHSVKACLVATEVGIIVLEKQNHEKDLSVSVRFIWSDVKKFIELSDSTFQINYCSSQLVIESLETPNVITGLYTICCNVLSVLPEVEGIVFSRRPLCRSTRHVIMRFRFLRLSKGKEVPLSIETALESFLKEQKSTFDIRKIPNAIDYLNDILQSVHNLPILKEIILPSKSDDPLWKIYASYLENNITIESLTFTEKITKEISTVTDSLVSNPKCCVKSISFANSSLTSDNVQYLLEFLSKKPLYDLSFSSCFSPQIFSYFISRLRTFESMKYLQSLTFDQFPDINIPELFSTFNSIKTIELRKCNVDISKLIPIINNHQISSIIVDGGVASSSISDKFSPSTNCFKFNNIKWEQYTFIEIWCILLQHSTNVPQISISLSDALCQPQVWQHFFQTYCSASIPNLTKLEWNNNPIQTQFIQFIMGCTGLNSLYLNGCFNLQNSQVFSQFSDSLSSNRSINFLSIVGTESSKVSSFLPRFFETLLVNQSLVSLDISNQAFGDGGLLSLASLIVNNKRLLSIKWDMNTPSSSESLSRFFDSILERNSPIDLQWPYEDVLQLKFSRKASFEDIKGLYMQYADVIAGKRGAGKPLTDLELIDTLNEQSELAPSVSTEELNKNPLWCIQIPPIPTPDNTQIIQQAMHNYSISNLLQQMQNWS